MLFLASLFIEDPTVFNRFNRQVPLSTFAYLAPGRGGPVAAFLSDFRVFSIIGRFYLFAIAALALQSVIAWRTLSRTSRRLFLVALGFAGANVLVWNKQPYYLWFPAIILLCVWLGDWWSGKNKGWRSRTELFLLFLSLMPLLLPEFEVELAAYGRPAEESNHAIREKVLHHIGSADAIAVSQIHYFSFRDRMRLANYAYNCESIERFPFVLVPPQSNQRQRVEPAPFPCAEKSHCFVLDADFTSPRVVSVFGRASRYYFPGFGGYLYKRIACSPR